MVLSVHREGGRRAREGEGGQAGGGRHQLSDSGGYFPCVEFHVHYLKWLAVGRKAESWLLFISAAVTANIKNALRGLIECLTMLFCDRPELHVCWAAYQLHLHFFFEANTCKKKQKKKSPFARAGSDEGGEKNLFRDKLTVGVISPLEK